MLQYMYLIQSKFTPTTGKELTSGGYIGGNNEEDAIRRHRNNLIMMHGPLNEFKVMSLTLEGSYDVMLKSILSEKD